jgi:hypothetical protein
MNEPFPVWEVEHWSCIVKVEVKISSPEQSCISCCNLGLWAAQGYTEAKKDC